MLARLWTIVACQLGPFAPRNKGGKTAGAAVVAADAVVGTGGTSTEAAVVAVAGDTEATTALAMDCFVEAAAVVVAC